MSVSLRASSWHIPVVSTCWLLVPSPVWIYISQICICCICCQLVSGDYVSFTSQWRGGWVASCSSSWGLAVRPTIFSTLPKQILRVEMNAIFDGIRSERDFSDYAKVNVHGNLKLVFFRQKKKDVSKALITQRWRKKESKVLNLDTETLTENPRWTEIGFGTTHPGNIRTCKEKQRGDVWSDSWEMWIPPAPWTSRRVLSGRVRWKALIDFPAFQLHYLPLFDVSVSLWSHCCAVICSVWMCQSPESFTEELLWSGWGGNKGPRVHKNNIYPKGTIIVHT